MAVIFPNGRIEGGNSAFRIVDTSNGTVAYEQGIRNYGGSDYAYSVDTTRVMFIASCPNDPGWINPTTSVWRKVSDYCTNVILNVGSCYNSTTTRFTAPRAGQYLFMYSCYDHGSYMHPIIIINGSVGYKKGSNEKYRMRHHGWYSSGYSGDMQVEEILFLDAGDYVEPYCYFNSTDSYYYPAYSLFQGMYIG